MLGKSWSSLLLILSVSAAAAGQEALVPTPDQPAFTLGKILRLDTRSAKSLQRSQTFLGVRSVKNQVQIAFVIDGTDSMQQELDAFREHLPAFAKNLQSQHADNPEFRLELALIVFRDVRAAAGATEFVLDDFTDDIGRLTTALAGVKSQTGAPYFQELVDVGVHEALAKLSWKSDSTETARWLILCGDAPPYWEADSERQFSTQALIADARRRNVRIYSVLANSGLIGESNQKLLDAAQSVKPEARQFMQALAEGSGGRFLDLWDTQAVQRFYEADEQFTRRIPPITDSDIEAIRNEKSDDFIKSGTLRIAILPHVPLKTMSFNVKAHLGVELAQALRNKYAHVPGLEVVSTPRLEKAFAAIAADTGDATSQEVLRNVARRVKADFLVWGDCESDFDQVVIESRLYDRFQKLAAAGHQAPPADANEMALFVFSKLRERALQSFRNKPGLSPEFVHVFGQIEQDDDLREHLETPLSKRHPAQQRILAGLRHLEIALESASGVAQPVAALTEARRELEGALQIEPRNPLTHLLLSACCYNLATSGETAAAAQQRQHLQLAYKHRNAGGLPREARTEIAAHHALLIERDVDQARALFTQLSAGERNSRGNFALRAHWMLAGIYLGDWDVGAQSADVKQARKHILQILAWWPDSPEAKFYQRCIAAGDSQQGFPALAPPTLVRMY